MRLSELPIPNISFLFHALSSPSDVNFHCADFLSFLLRSIGELLARKFALKQFLLLECLDVRHLDILIGVERAITFRFLLSFTFIFHSTRNTYDQ
jgi:hypothetical protein